MGAYNNLQEMIAGLQYGIQTTKISTKVCKESAGINFGAPLFGHVGDAESCYTMHNNVSTLVYSADFVSLNSIIVTINGVASTPVVFDTNQATTMLALIAQLESDFTGLVATNPDVAGDDRTLKLELLTGVDNISTSVVTLGASQATASATMSTTMIYLGIALFMHKSSQTTVGIYDQYDSVNCMEQGEIVVTTQGTVEALKTAYVIQTDGSTQGLFSTAGFDTGCKYKGSRTGAGLVVIETYGQKG